MPITISEKEIEDQAEYMVQDFIHPNAVTLERQYTLPSGKRADLIVGHREVNGMGDYIITVVEIKADTARLPDLIQLLGYVEELERGEFANTPIRGVLLAPGFAPEVTQIAARMTSIGVWQVQCSLGFASAPLVPDPFFIEECGQRYVTTEPTKHRGWKVNQEAREAIGELVDELEGYDDAARVWHDNKRFRALVPTSLSPHRFAFNGNGRGQ